MTRYDPLDDVDVRMSFRNGFQLTVDINAPDAWHYIAVGVTGHLTVKHGRATDDDVSETLADMAEADGTHPKRKYAAGHGEHIETLLEVPLTDE